MSNSVDFEQFKVVFQEVCPEKVFRPLSFANISIYQLTHRQACLPMSIFIRPGTDVLLPVQLDHTFGFEVVDAVMLFAGGEAEEGAGDDYRKQGVQGKFLFHLISFK